MMRHDEQSNIKYIKTFACSANLITGFKDYGHSKFRETSFFVIQVSIIFCIIISVCLNTFVIQTFFITNNKLKFVNINKFVVFNNIYNFQMDPNERKRKAPPLPRFQEPLARDPNVVEKVTDFLQQISKEASSDAKT